MKLQDIFTKPVDRTIEGVIKADDLTSLKLEVEEYVITNEVSRSLEQFLGAYNEYQGANGVWISDSRIWKIPLIEDARFTPGE